MWSEFLAEKAVKKTLTQHKDTQTHNVQKRGRHSFTSKVFLDVEHSSSQCVELSDRGADPMSSGSVHWLNKLLFLHDWLDFCLTLTITHFASASVHKTVLHNYLQYRG